MARVTAPLLSFGGAGQIAKTQVYASWKGIPYARRYVIPANPNSTEQQKTRNAFAWLNDVYQLAPQAFRDPWAAFVKGKPLTERNAWISKNLPILRPLTALTGIVMSPGANGGLTTTATLTGGANQVTVALATPAVLPAGWSIVGSTGVCIQAQNPQSGTDFEIFTASDASDPYAPVITGLAATTSYFAAGWLIYQRSALATDLAYGPAIGATVSTS